MEDNESNFEDLPRKYSSLLKRGTSYMKHELCQELTPHLNISSQKLSSMQHMGCVFKFTLLKFTGRKEGAARMLILIKFYLLFFVTGSYCVTIKKKAKTQTSSHTAITLTSKSAEERLIWPNCFAFDWPSRISLPLEWPIMFSLQWQKAPECKASHICVSHTSASITSANILKARVTWLHPKCVARDLCCGGKVSVTCQGSHYRRDTELGLLLQSITFLFSVHLLKVWCSEHFCQSQGDSLFLFAHYSCKQLCCFVCSWGKCPMIWEPLLTSRVKSPFDK